MYIQFAILLRKRMQKHIVSNFTERYHGGSTLLGHGAPVLVNV